MRVLSVVQSVSLVNGGGNTARTVQMTKSLRHAGVDCTILATDRGMTAEQWPDLDGLHVIALPCLVERFYIPLVSHRRLRQLIAQADLIHLMGHWTPLNALVYIYARRLHKPYVACPAGALPVYGRSRWLKRLFNGIVGRRIIAEAQGKIAITASELPHFATYGVAPDDVVVIPNGIDPDDYIVPDGVSFRDACGLVDRPFALFVGRLNPIKGPALLLRAFGATRHAVPHHLVFAGVDEGMLAGLR